MILWLGSRKTASSPLGILLNENILQMPASFRQSRTFEACSAESSRNLKKSSRLEKILRRPHGLLGLRSVFSRIRLSYLIEVLRHGDLAEALGLPWASVGLGYEYVNRGETPPDMKRETLRRTSSG